MKVPIILIITAIAHAQKSPHIIGGNESVKGRWPWQLSMQFKGSSGFSHSCGASLISSDWALTAAHCFLVSDDPSEFRILLGAFRVSPTNDADQILAVTKIIEHPEFDFTRFGLPDDIALVKLNGTANLQSSNISTIALPDETNDFADNPGCYITGWGRNHVDAEGASPTLMELNIPVLNNTYCEERYDDHIIGWIHPILDTHICVGDKHGKLSACQGDSGGPLACDQSGKWVLAGVTSRGDPECQEAPSVYTRVTKYNKWIRDTINSST